MSDDPVESDDSYVVVRGEAPLFALYRALYAAKFAEEPLYVELTASPYIAEVITDVFRITQRLIEKRIDRGECLGSPERAHRELREHEFMHPEHVEWPMIVKRASEGRKWAEWSRDQRVRYLELLSAPFCVTEAMADDLLESVAQHRGEELA